MRLCRELVKGAWAGVERDLDHLGPNVGGFLSEFGAVGEDESSLELIRLQTEGADRLLQSWAYWTYKSFDDVTTQNAATETLFQDPGVAASPGGQNPLQLGKAKALARTFARAVAGTPTRMSFDAESANFQLDYVVETVDQSWSSATRVKEAKNMNLGGKGAAAGESCTAGLTEIYLHVGFYYPGGYTVSLEWPGGHSVGAGKHLEKLSSPRHEGRAERAVGGSEDPVAMNWAVLESGESSLAGGAWCVLGVSATGLVVGSEVSVLIEPAKSSLTPQYPSK